MSSSSSHKAARREPPEGALWNSALGAAPLAFVDLEMTGLEPERHHIVQLCIERVVGAELQERLLSFVKPPVEGSLGVAHGITQDDIAAAPAFGSIADEVRRLLDGAVLVAHAAVHDVAFLRAELARVGHSWDCTHYVDTLALSRRAFSLPSHRLTALAKALEIPYPRPHRADGDVAVLRRVFERVVTTFEPATPRALWLAAFGKRPIRAGVLATAERALELGYPVKVRYRSARKTREFDFLVRQVRTDLDPPLVLGYLQRTRGRRELRADRILNIEMLGHDPSGSIDGS